MLNARSTAILLLAALCLLSGCPKPAGKGGTPDGSTPQTDSQAPKDEGPLKGGVSPSDSTPDSSADMTGGSGGAATSGSADSGDGSDTGAAGDQNQKPAAPAEQSELTGRWFALFGGERGGVALYTYEDQRFVVFSPDGTLDMSAPGVPNAHLRGRFELAGGRLRVKLDDPRFDGATLLSGGHHTGGSIPAQAPPGHSTPEQLGLKVSGDRQFLILSDGKGKMTVYGRDDTPLAGGISGLDGQWMLYLGPRDSYPATLSSGPGELQINWNNQLETFSGHFSHGYFVGELHTGKGLGMGALTQAADGTLNGVWSLPPYFDVMPLFDLKRGGS